MSRKRKPKEVVQYANEEHPEKCIVRLFKLYSASKHPEKRPDNAFYLTLLRHPKSDVWHSVTPLGHNQLSKIVGNLMKDIGFPGHFTNHSLRVSCATRLYTAQVDEQLIMSRTSHSSTDGVRAYKRSSEKLKKLTSYILNSRGNDQCPNLLPSECAFLRRERKRSPTFAFLVEPTSPSILASLVLNSVPASSTSFPKISCNHLLPV